MKTLFALLFSISIISGCKNASFSDLNEKLNIANEFIDAFYSFDKDFVNTYKDVFLCF